MKRFEEIPVSRKDKNSERFFPPNWLLNLNPLSPNLTEKFFIYKGAALIRAQKNHGDSNRRGVGIKQYNAFQPQ